MGQLNVRSRGLGCGRSPEQGGGWFRELQLLTGELLIVEARCREPWKWPQVAQHGERWWAWWGPQPRGPCPAGALALLLTPPSPHTHPSPCFWRGEYVGAGLQQGVCRWPGQLFINFCPWAWSSTPQRVPGLQLR